MDSCKANVKETDLVGIFFSVPLTRLGISFLKCNSSISNSTMIKHAFSFGSDIMKPKKVRLLSENFEGFVFIGKNQKRGASRLVLAK